MAETILSPPVGVLVVLVIARSGRTLVELVLAELQSLVGFGSPSSGWRAVAPAAPPGKLLPVQAWLVADPATVAVVMMVSVGSEAPALRPAAFGWSQVTVLPETEQVQPVPDSLT